MVSPEAHRDEGAAQHRQHYAGLLAQDQPQRDAERQGREGRSRPERNAGVRQAEQRHDHEAADPDQRMFEAFPHSIGVANVARFVPQLAHLPRYVTQGERGAGFAQFCAALLSR